MKVVGCDTAYSIVPFEASDDTLDGQVIVDWARVELLMLDDPKNGSFLPH